MVYWVDFLKTIFKYLNIFINKGGSQGNENNFETKEKCIQQCDSKIFLYFYLIIIFSLFLNFKTFVRCPEKLDHAEQLIQDFFTISHQTNAKSFYMVVVRAIEITLIAKKNVILDARIKKYKQTKRKQF